MPNVNGYWYMVLAASVLCGMPKVHGTGCYRVCFYVSGKVIPMVLDSFFLVVYSVTTPFLPLQLKKRFSKRNVLNKDIGLRKQLSVLLLL